MDDSYKNEQFVKPIAGVREGIEGRNGEGGRGGRRERVERNISSTYTACACVFCCFHSKI